MTRRDATRDAAVQCKTALADLDRLDQAVYAAIAAAPTPTLDVALRRVSNAANYSRLWVGVAVGLALVGGRPGRSAAGHGLAAIGVASAAANLVAKQVMVRKRPDREAAAVAAVRHVRMPESTSFPSGHTASAFAFASAAGGGLPVLSVPLHLLATVVGYSRVHTGVHYPGDVIVGAFAGSAAGALVNGHRRRATCQKQRAS